MFRSDSDTAILFLFPNPVNAVITRSPRRFQAIAISPIISKVFEHCILKIFQSLFTTSRSQFGCKKNTSCSNAIPVARSTVDNIIRCGNTANLCAIDLSKAFDKVNHHALYLKLMNGLFLMNS